MDSTVTDAGIGPALGAAGPCPTIEYEGTAWKVGHPTQRAKVALEHLVVESAAANIEAMRPAWGKKKTEEKLDALDMQVMGGHHKTAGALWNAINSGPDSVFLFLTSLLRENHPDATLVQGRKLWVNCPREVRRALALTVPAFFTLIAADLPGTPQSRAEAAAEYSKSFLETVGTPDAST